MRHRWYRYVDNIATSGLSIYDLIQVGDPDLWLPTEALEYILNKELRGVSLAGLPLRTRSKHFKAHVCRAIGYPVPSSFHKTQPRFVGQLFDTYGQKSNNLQIWNEDIDLERRYVIAGINEHDVIYGVRVIIGEELQNYDTTGTLTQKYQAQFSQHSSLVLASHQDTEPIRSILGKSSIPAKIPGSPISFPLIGRLLPISEVFNRLSPLVGMSFADA